MNYIRLTGNVGNEMTIRDFGYNRLITFTMADNSPPAGKMNTTAWHRIVAFGKTADHCEALLCRGKHILVEGKLTYRKIPGEEYQRITEILAFRVEGVAPPETFTS